MIMPLIILGVMLNAFAQIILKEAMTRMDPIRFQWSHAMTIGFKVFTNPFVVAGLFCYVLSVMVWLVVLSKVDVSYAYPMLSIGYIVTAFAAYFILHEPMSMHRILGIIIIIGGVYVLSRSG